MEEKIHKIKDLIKAAKREARAYEKSTKWTPILNDDEKTKHIGLYEAETADGIYLLKTTAMLKNTDPKKILMLNMDNNFETRKQWETDDLSYIEQLEAYPDEKVNVVRFRVALPVVKDREFLGFQYLDYKKKNDTQILIFKTFKYDERYPCDEDKYVAGDALTIMTAMRHKEHHCFLTIYSYIRPNGWITDSILPLWKEKLRKRVLLYETIANTTFDQIYGKRWHCGTCEGVFSVEPDGDLCQKCRNQVKEVVEL